MVSFRHPGLIAAWLAFGLVAARPAAGCTTVLLSHGQDVVVAKSYDYYMGQGHVVVNPRGLRKSSMVFGDEPVASWVARYGSVTFNQYGRELPASGMNEAGLVVEVMWLDQTRYPAPDGRPVLPDLQWIQYQLDRWATVEEVVAHAGETRVTSRTARIHFLVCDRTAACAAVELIDGELVIHSGDRMPVRTLTNDTYEASCTYLARHQGFGGSEPVPTSLESLDRFVRASSLAAAAGREDRGGPGLVDDGFTILDSVSMGQYSVWNLVYEPRRGRIHYRTHVRPRVKRIDLGSLDFSCAAGARQLDMDAERSGDVSRSLHPYDSDANLRLVRTSFGRSRVPIPSAAAAAVGRFPDRFTCAGPPPDH